MHAHHNDELKHIDCLRMDTAASLTLDLDGTLISSCWLADGTYKLNRLYTWLERWYSRTDIEKQYFETSSQKQTVFQ